METLHTIVHNAQVLANAEIDWSPHAGPFWLVLLIVSMVAGMVAAAYTEVN